MQETTSQNDELIREFFSAKTSPRARKAMTDADREMDHGLLKAIRRLDISRNQPCPCGSRKLFKRCCLALVDQGPRKIE